VLVHDGFILTGWQGLFSDRLWLLVAGEACSLVVANLSEAGPPYHKWILVPLILEARKQTLYTKNLFNGKNDRFFPILGWHGDILRSLWSSNALIRSVFKVMLLG